MHEEDEDSLDTKRVVITQQSQCQALWKFSAFAAFNSVDIAASEWESKVWLSQSTRQVG